MATGDPLKIKAAIVSDLHFCDALPQGSGSESSHIVVQKLPGATSGNPWTDLMKLVHQSGLKADVLLCPGDITTHAAKVPLETAWKGLVDLGKALSVSVVACATGNHDVSSRPTKQESPLIRALDKPQDLFENLKLLSPEYPVHVLTDHAGSQSNRQRRINYFGADFVIHSDDRTNIVVFNSCARHLNDQLLYERGLIAQSALIELREQLSKLPSSKINLFLCHHHPIPHSQAGAGSYDFIHRGDELVSCLEENGDWIVIHGHKHEGRIVYAPSANPGASPVVLSASSLGTNYSKDALNQLRNQFYILDIELPPSGGCSRGIAHVWNWGLAGWTKSLDPKTGLVDGTGFGERGHADTLANEIAKAVGTTVVSWEEIRQTHPFLNHLTQEGMRNLEKSLKQRHSIVIGRDPITGVRNQIGPEEK